MSDVLRWMCDQYRIKLYQVDPRSCRQIDEIMIRVGQGWICDDGVVNPDDFMTAREIEQRHGIKEFNVRALARRHGVKTRGKRAGANLYRLGDILAARSGKKV